MFVVVHTDSSGDGKCPGLPRCICNKALTSVNCKGKHFKFVPQIPETAEKLYLSDNDFTTIPTRAFTGLPNLQKLFLDHNKIIIIKPFAFDGLKNLTDLDLRNNKVYTLDNNSLASIPRLTHLYLTTNKIQSIAKNAFSGTSSLEYINIQSNSLPEVPSFGYQPYLNQIIIEGNKIANATFPPSFMNCSRKTSIILSNNAINTLTSSTFQSLANSSLSKLYLSRNNITSVEAGTFAGLSSIVSLKLGLNPLDSLSLKTAVAGLEGKNVNSLDISGIALAGVLMEDTFSLLKNTTLASLIMRFNAIKLLRDNTFSQLKSLLMLDLSSSQINEARDKAFYGLEQLSTLKLNDNRFVSIPKNLPPSLHFLYLNGNRFKTISENIFSNLNQIEYLRMDGNRILTLENGAFNGLVNLKVLELYNNNIHILPGTIFSTLVSLNSLDLSNNNLHSIQTAKDRFSSLVSLQYLNLADNQCTFVQSDIFNPLKALKYLHLEGNSLGERILDDHNGQLFEGLRKLEHLYIMNNNIEALPDLILKDLLSLTILNASVNKLSAWEPDLFKTTQNLSTLDLSFNLITSVKDKHMQSLGNLRYLNLTRNPFSCNCDLRWFRDWISKTQTVVSNNDSYTCYEPRQWSGKLLLEFNRNKINCLFFSMYAIIGATLGGLSISFLSCALVYKNRWRLRLRLYRLSGRGRRFFKKAKTAVKRGNYGAIENDQELYDAYVSCNEQDTPWALHHLLPGVDNGRLEKDFGGNFRLYYEDRDSEPGNLPNILTQYVIL